VPRLLVKKQKEKKMAYLFTEEPRRVLMEMFRQGELCDLTVVSQDQETHRSFRVHALVLISMSEDLMEFLNSSDSTETRRLLLPYSAKTTEALITTAYEGAETVQLDVSKEEDRVDIIRAAIHLKIPELQRRVASLMREACSTSSMLDLKRTCRMFSGEGEFLKLSEDLLIFISKNVDHLIATEVFHTFSAEEMKELLGCRHLQLTREAAQSFLASWLSSNHVENLTRTVKGHLSSLAKRPTSFRLPATVILAAGGLSNGPTNLVEVFNTLDFSWMVAPAFTMPRARAYELEVMGNKLWSVGGCCLDSLDWTHEFDHSLHEFDLATGTWTEKSSMGRRRGYFSTNVLHGKIFAMGGQDGGSLRSVEVYDPARNQWDDLAPMVHHRSDFASVVLRGHIYAIGGFHDFHYQSTIERYDPLENRWSLVGSLQGGRCGASAVVARDRIFVIGGCDGYGQMMASVECFTPGLVANVWHPVPDMLHRRSDFSAVLLDSNTIMVVGGCPGAMDSTLGQVEFLDISQNVWRVGPDLKVPRSALRAVSVDNFYD